MKLEELKKVAVDLAEKNERGRLLISEGKIRGYLIFSGKRLENLSADESAEKIIKEIAKDPRHYEYEPGKLHLFL